METQWKLLWTYIETHYCSVTELYRCKTKAEKKYKLGVYYSDSNSQQCLTYANRLVDFLDDYSSKVRFLVGACNNDKFPMGLFIPDELYLKHHTPEEIYQAVVDYEANELC